MESLGDVDTRVLPADTRLSDNNYGNGSLRFTFLFFRIFRVGDHLALVLVFSGTPAADLEWMGEVFKGDDVQEVKETTTGSFDQVQSTEQRITFTTKISPKCARGHDH